MGREEEEEERKWGRWGKEVFLKWGEEEGMIYLAVRVCTTQYERFGREEGEFRDEPWEKWGF